jgi:ribosomal-protein-serine acetyltransferase
MAEFALDVDETIRLRLLRREDAAELYALLDRNRAHLGRWLPAQMICQTLGEAECYIHWSRVRYEHTSAFDAGVWHAGRLAGMISLQRSDREWRKPAIGYWLGAEYQGLGLVTCAARAVVTHAFDVYGLHRMTIRCAVENARSRAIPERLGFRLERVEPHAEQINDVWLDDAVYGMFDWKWRGEPHPIVARHRAAQAKAAARSTTDPNGHQSGS